MLTGSQVILFCYAFTYFTTNTVSFVIQKRILKKKDTHRRLSPAGLGTPSSLEQTLLVYRIPPTCCVPLKLCPFAVVSCQSCASRSPILGK